MRGDFWELRYGGRSALVEDSRGLRYIALLIQNAAANRGPVHARELVALASGHTNAPTELEAPDALLDERAQKQLVSRLEELAHERERACAAEDFVKAQRLDEEYEQIAAELGRAARPKRGRSAVFNDATERARKAVGKAITEAISRIGTYKEVAPLAEHLREAVRKGQWLSYSGTEDWLVDVRGPLPRK